MHGDSDLSLFELETPGFEVELAEGVHAHYSAMQLFATSLALCTASVLVAYAEQIGTPAGRLSVRIRWGYAEGPFRIDRIDLQLFWPELPASRHQAAERAAQHCTLHHTLEHPPVVLTAVHRWPAPPLEREEGAQPAAPPP